MLYLAVIFSGLVLGSFATALIYRIPRCLSWAFETRRVHVPAHVAGRSCCTSCKIVLKPRDLVPVLSWVFAGGRCRHCGNKISPMYPAVELGVLAFCVLTYWVKGPSVECLFIILAIPFLVALLVIDLQFFLLPDQLIVFLSLIGLGRLIYGALHFHDCMILISGIVSSVAFGVFIGGLGWLMTRLLKKEALGFGDVKFFAMAGLWLGFIHMGSFCILAGLFGVIFSLFWKAINKDAVFPFGPALIAAFYVILIAQNSFLPPFF